VPATLTLCTSSLLRKLTSRIKHATLIVVGKKPPHGLSLPTRSLCSRRSLVVSSVELYGCCPTRVLSSCAVSLHILKRCGGASSLSSMLTHSLKICDGASSLESSFTHSLFTYVAMPVFGPPFHLAPFTLSPCTLSPLTSHPPTFQTDGVQ